MSLHLLLENHDQEANFSNNGKENTFEYSIEEQGECGEDIERDTDVKGANVSLISVSPDRSKIAICRSQESTELYIYHGLHSLLDRSHISQLQSSQNIAKDLSKKFTAGKKPFSSQIKRREKKKGSLKNPSFTLYKIPEELTSENFSEKEDGTNNENENNLHKKNTIRSKITALKWISTSHLALGFESGLLRVIACNCICR